MGGAKTSPMTYYEAILSVLSSLPSTYVERPGIAPPEYAESAENRKARLSTVALELSRYTPKTVAGVIAIGDGESTFALYTLRDCESRPPKASGDCDRIKVGKDKGKIRARSYFQLWRQSCKPLWELADIGEVGTDKTVRVAIGCAARLFRSAYINCKRQNLSNVTERAFGQYGGRGCIQNSRNAKKAKTFKKVLRLIDGQASYTSVETLTKESSINERKGK